MNDTQYQIVIYTGNRRGASLKNGDVYVMLVGDKDTSSERRLPRDSQCFNKGSVDKFWMTGCNVGHLHAIHVRHTSKKAWFLDKIEVLNTNAQVSYLFPFQDWIKKGWLNPAASAAMETVDVLDSKGNKMDVRALPKLRIDNSPSSEVYNSVVVEPVEENSEIPSYWTPQSSSHFPASPVEQLPTSAPFSPFLQLQTQNGDETIPNLEEDDDIKGMDEISLKTTEGETLKEEEIPPQDIERTSSLLITQEIAPEDDEKTSWDEIKSTQQNHQEQQEAAQSTEADEIGVEVGVGVGVEQISVELIENKNVAEMPDPKVVQPHQDLNQIVQPQQGEKQDIEEAEHVDDQRPSQIVQDFGVGVDDPKDEQIPLLSNEKEEQGKRIGVISKKGESELSVSSPIGEGVEYEDSIFQGRQSPQLANSKSQDENDGIFDVVDRQSFLSRSVQSSGQGWTPQSPLDESNLNVSLSSIAKNTYIDSKGDMVVDFVAMDGDKVTQFESQQDSSDVLSANFEISSAFSDPLVINHKQSASIKEQLKQNNHEKSKKAGKLVVPFSSPNYTERLSMFRSEYEQENKKLVGGKDSSCGTHYFEAEDCFASISSGSRIGSGQFVPFEHHSIREVENDLEDNQLQSIASDSLEPLVSHSPWYDQTPDTKTLALIKYYPEVADLGNRYLIVMEAGGLEKNDISYKIISSERIQLRVRRRVASRLKSRFGLTEMLNTHPHCIPDRVYRISVDLLDPIARENQAKVYWESGLWILELQK
eukprot:TRINITY_DN3047_c0_g2_i1.p1 TRINITY_DN3047_c0_g2~~TRINITY_DN3047_c0_g2_i1.p1  ORF type:complete len:760 (-),score=149.71 TRINITY_DN3047_c0_g2_i1:1425-3704(-)